MWILVQVIKGNKYFEAESRVENHVLICDSSEMVIAGRALGTDGYRFEARKGNESFVVSEFPARAGTGPLIAEFKALAERMGAIATAVPA